MSYGRATSDGTSSRDKLQDENFCIYETLKSLIKVNRKGGMATIFRLLHGDGESGQFIQKKVSVRPWVHFISGDHEEHNQLCAHFNTFNKGVSMPFRDCHCTFNNMDAHTYKCKPVTAEELKGIKGNEVRMKNFSRHCLTFNAFKNAHLSQVIDSILPLETLHVFGNGITKYFIDILLNILGPKNKIK